MRPDRGSPHNEAAGPSGQSAGGDGGGRGRATRRESDQGWRGRLGALPATELAGGLVVHDAMTARARRRGLGGLGSLPSDRALHLRPCRAVHTIGMRFALDLVWLDARGAVVRVDRDVAPRRHRVCRAARSVVELRAGSADRLLASGYTGAR